MVSVQKNEILQTNQNTLQLTKSALIGLRAARILTRYAGSNMESRGIATAKTSYLENNDRSLL